MKKLHYTVDSRGAKKRLDLFLAEAAPSLTRSQIKRLIESRHITVNQLPVKAAARLKDGDVIELDLPPPRELCVGPEPIPLNVIFEDDAVIVVTKPAGMVVHPAAGNATGGAVFEALTAQEYLRFVASLYHIADDEAELRIARFASFFDLDGDTLTGKPLAAYSKGMRQRVVITSALLHKPRVVFFDEPLNGLDANAALSFKTLITSLAREGKTIIYCSHILDVVERICERVVIIHEGRIVADGTVAELRERAGVATLEATFNKLTATENLLARAEEFARARLGSAHCARARGAREGRGREHRRAQHAAENGAGPEA